jgi:uncharacterized membrane protein
MTVSEFAPMVLTCRNCLGKVQNPQGLPPGTVIPQSAVMPRRVIPIEEQVAGDTRLASIMLFILAAVLGGAAALSASIPNGGRVAIGLGIVAVLTLTVAVLQLVYPQSEEVRATAFVLDKVAKVVVAFILIIVGVALLLLGICYVLIAGSGFHGS